MARPRVTVRTNQYASPNERLVEFSFPNGKGGIISFRDTWTQNALGETVHTCIVDVFRLDNGITVLAPETHYRAAGIVEAKS